MSNIGGTLLSSGHKSPAPRSALSDENKRDHPVFLSELCEKRQVDDATFPADGAHGYTQPVIVTDSDSNTPHLGIGMPSNLSFVK